MAGEPESRIEADRLGRLSGLGEDTDLSGFAPGSFGCHELLDRTALLAGSVDDWLLNNPACLSRPDWFRLASKALNALQELYDNVAEEHIDADAGPADDPNTDQGR